MADTLINGIRPSFVSVAVTLADKSQPPGVFTSISYGLQQEPALIYSKSTGNVVGSTPNMSSGSGSFEMLVAELNDFFKYITEEGAVSITSPVFDIQVSYSVKPDDIDLVIDVLRNCRIGNINVNSGGTSASTKVCSFTFDQLITNGIAAGNDASMSSPPKDDNGNERQPVVSDFWGGPVYETDDGKWLCPGFFGSTYSGNAWDFVGLRCGEGPLDRNEEPKTPGIVDVSFSKVRSFDKKKSAGTDNPRITMHGLEAAEGEFRVTIWTAQQYRMLKKLWSEAFPAPQKQTTTTTRTVAEPTTKRAEFFGSGDSSGITSGQSLTIPQVAKTKRVTEKVTKVNLPVVPYTVTHPDLARMGVSSVIFTGAGNLEPGPTPLSRTFVMRWLQWASPGIVNTTTTPNAAKAVAPLPSTLEQYQPPGKNPANKGPL